MRDVSYDRPVTAKLYVHLDNGEQFEATPEDLRKFGVAIPEPLPPAPFVRGVDELSDDEVNEDARGAWPWGGVNGFDGQYMGFLRDFATAVAARLRVDGPGREPEPAEITAAMLDAAEVGWKVDDAEGDTWTKFRDGWGLVEGRRHAVYLLTNYGPLTNLRPPPAEPAQPEPHPVEVFGNDTAYGTRDRLIALALHAAGGYYQRDGLPAQVAAAAEMDQAAREHAAALPGPATGGAIAGPHVVLGSDMDDAMATFATVEHESRETESAYLRRKGALAAVLRQFAARGAKIGGYDPSALAPGSVVAKNPGGICLAAREPGFDGARWVTVFRNADGWHFETCHDYQVPHDGALVVDGATLGAWEVEPDE